MGMGAIAAKPLVWIDRMGNAHPAWYYTMPLVACVATIMIGSLLPSSELPRLHTSDKILHGAMYACLGWLMLRAWVRDQRPTGAAVLLVAGIGAAWGLYLECLQGLTPDRSFDLIDEIANVTGVSLGVLCWLGWRSLFQKISA